MATFVLVPGAWLGAWVWEPLVAQLRTLGHDAVPVTLRGLDGTPGDMGLDEHVDDVVTAVRRHPGCVLVGHSYAGVVVGQAADRAETLVRHTVYVDANLPHDGEALTAPWSPRGREFVADLIADHDGWWPRPEAGDFAGHGLTDDQIAWLAGRVVAHPGRTIFDPVVLSRPASGTYIASLLPNGLSAEVAGLRRRPGWRVETLDTGHWPMVSAPEELAALLTATP